MLQVEFFVASVVMEMPPADGEAAAIDMTGTLDFTMVMKHPLRARIIPRTRSD
jgi:hypothetical protein